MWGAFFIVLELLLWCTINSFALQEVQKELTKESSACFLGVFFPSGHEWMKQKLALSSYSV